MFISHLTPDTDGPTRMARHGLLLMTLATTLATAACASEPGDVTPTRDSSDAARIGACVRDAGHDVDDQWFVDGGVTLPRGVEPKSDQASEYLDLVTRCEAAAAGSGSRDTSSPPDAAALQTTLTAYASCLREAGFDDVPDPVGGVLDLPPAYDAPEADPAFVAASERCAAPLADDLP